MATRLGEPVRISKCGRCSVRFSTPGAGSPPWNCPHCDKRIARDALRVRAERRLRCPVCLASIAHRGPCAVTCGRSCAMRLHRARRRIRVASSAPLLCPVCGPPPPRPGLGLVPLSGTEDVGELAFACGLCLTSIVGRMMEPAEA